MHTRTGFLQPDILKKNRIELSYYIYKKINNFQTLIREFKLTNKIICSFLALLFISKIENIVH